MQLGADLRVNNLTLYYVSNDKECLLNFDHIYYAIYSNKN